MIAWMTLDLALASSALGISLANAVALWFLLKSEPSDGERGGLDA